MDENARQDIAKTLKLELISRVLSNMAQPVFEKHSQTPMMVPESGEHAAVVLATGLQSTCGVFNIWCTAGAWVLRGVNAVFGSSSAVTDFRSKFDGTTTETWSANTAKWNTGATSFPSEK